MHNFSLNKDDSPTGNIPNETSDSFNLKKKLLEESVNNILMTPYLQAKMQDYGQPKTTKVVLKSKDPMNYSTNKKIEDLDKLSMGRWSPIKLKPIAKTKHTKMNNIFDVGISFLFVLL